jgi:hypothetical protein
MAKIFEINTSGVRAFLQSQEMLKLTEKYADRYEGEKKSFIGFDRAKTIVYGKEDRK